MDTYELSCAVEALLFAQAVPMDFAAIRAALRRAMPEPDAEAPEEAWANEDAGAVAQAADVTLEAPASAAARTRRGPDVAPDVASAQAAIGDAPDAASAAAEDSGATDAEPTAAPQASSRPGPVDAGVAALAAELAGGEPQKGASQVAEADAPRVADAASSAPDAPEAANMEATLAPDDVGASEAAKKDASAADLPPLLLTSPVPKVPRPPSFSVQLQQAIALLQERWRDPSGRRGFALVEVAGGLTFRTNPRHAELLRAVRQPRAARLSRAVLETLAIAAYRQPTTKPEIDQLRGVDSGGSLKVLLERRLLTVVGKKEEPGRPLLYGTTPDFLSHFNLSSVANLPSLREFHELADDDDAAGPGGLAGLAELARVDPKFRVDEAIGTDELEAAVAELQRTQGSTRAALLAQGVRLTDDEEAGSSAGAQEAPTHH